GASCRGGGAGVLPQGGGAPAGGAAFAAVPSGPGLPASRSPIQSTATASTPAAATPAPNRQGGPYRRKNRMPFLSASARADGSMTKASTGSAIFFNCCGPIF